MPRLGVSAVFLTASLVHLAGVPTATDATTSASHTPSGSKRTRCPNGVLHNFLLPLVGTKGRFNSLIKPSLGGPRNPFSPVDCAAACLKYEECMGFAQSSDPRSNQFNFTCILYNNTQHGIQSQADNLWPTWKFYPWGGSVAQTEAGGRVCLVVLRAAP